ncbi:universal stress protein [Streptomyces nanshensis]|uniref:UspA domain-containing protein n=1 Tax=Streptomyces nanshensis TaxID=518642 RepID=A0A1E7L817_9ACTN|nr:universal stress protein [Streptomyces nanshensis]OEV12346.1 hypothetical protein AN218_08670 [Streptomyces nanshensis]
MERAMVVGVDGSQESMAAAGWAAEEAERRGLPVRLLHAWMWQPVDVPVAQDPDGRRRAAEGLLQLAEKDLGDRYPAVRFTAEAVSETAVPALLRAAERSEMLVLGSRGYGALMGYLLGSCGQQVIGAATRPVVAVRARTEAPVRREVVVGQQGGAQLSGTVLKFAFEAAAARDATVRAVRAWTLPPVFAAGAASLQLVDEAGGLEPYEKEALEEALAPWRARYPEVPVVEQVETGSPGQVLLEAAEGAELLVVGRRARRAPIGSRIGSVAHACLHHAHCPVAVVPHG